MYAALLPALATCGVALSIAGLVLARRHRAPIHWVYLGLLVAIVLWTGGFAWRHTLTHDDSVRRSLDVIYLGIFSAPVLWFWLAALYTRSPLAELRWLPFASVVLPAVGYLLWRSNDLHGLFASEVSHAALRAGPRVFAGPAFWMVMTWTLGFALAGVCLMLGHAWKLRGRERSRSIELSVAALAPLVLAQVYLFRLFPIPYDLTPTGFCVTTLIFYGLLTREGIFEALPLARRDVIEDLQDGVIIADGEGLVLDTNPAGRALLGTGEGMPVGVSLTALLVASAVEEAEDDIVREVARALSEGTPGGLGFDTQAGRRVQLGVATVRSQGGQPAGAYAVLRDTTEQHRYEQMVRQSQKLESVGVLAAGVAHEVNNPLAFIQANLGSLQQMADTVERNLHRLPEKDARELAELREVLDESLEGIARISRIVNRLRRFSRAPEARSGPVEPNAVIEEAVRFVRLDRQGGCQVAADLAPDLPAVRGSRDGLTQVLLNLLMNAAQAVHGRPDGCISIASRLEGDRVRISVRDNGPGVPEPIRAHVFDPFFTTKPPDEGTGLGLAIAFDIVREHGGQLELCEDELCEGAGEGACFCLRLPLAEAHAA